MWYYRWPGKKPVYPGRRRLFCEALESRVLLAADFPQFVDPNPAPGNLFGDIVVPLSTGNVVVTSPYDDFGGTDAGAVYLFNGATGALISTLRGSHDGDNIGLGGVVALTNGNYVVSSLFWNNFAGAATWGSGTAGVKGVISSANSLVGSAANDEVGGSGVIALTNGNYVVSSPFWDDGATVDAGAATWGSGTAGLQGVISAANSLVGSTAGDAVGNGGATALANGNYVVSSVFWNNGAADRAGAATWGNGTAGVTGAVSAANSLVGNTAGDLVGSSGVTALTNGNYVVISQNWDNGAVANAGAATWGNGATGVQGVISAANSLVGSTDGDAVGNGGATALANGNYVVSSSLWDNGAVDRAGAATWGSGTTGITGAVSAANSLVGSTANDQVGNFAVTALTNGNYVVCSPNWDNGAVANAGAATWGNGATGVQGVISDANSLVGSADGDAVGNGGATALTNGNYVVRSHIWNNGAAADAGAATWGSGTTGITGAVSAANSLVGSTANDQVGNFAVTALTNGNYVVCSPNWDNGAVANAGAATWGSGTAGITGAVSAANSLVGSTAEDRISSSGVTALTNGNYVVSSPLWDGAAAHVGAATWGSGTTGVAGAVSAANSLVGSTDSDFVGGNGVEALTNGNYVVRSTDWDNGATVDAGAATWGSGTAGITGAVSAANSLVGSTANDQVGFSFVTALTNGHYVVGSPRWDNGATANAAAVTWGNGTTGLSGTINSQNSALGTVASAGVRPLVADDINRTFFARFTDEGGGTIRVGSQFNGFAPAPVIGDFGSAISFTENAPPLRITTTATVSDVDSPNFAGGRLVVKLVAGARSEDRLTILTAGNISTNDDNKVLFDSQIIGSFSGGVGATQLVVNFNAQATPGRVQQLLRQIAYHNVSDNPFTNVRTVRVNLNDGDGGVSAPVTKQISVVAVNDAPVLDGISGDVGYTQNTAPIFLASGATVTDPDSANFEGGRLMVRTISGAHASNRLLVAGAFELDGDEVKRKSDGLVIGTRNANGGVGTTRLEITFNSNATRALVQQLVRGIRFRTTGGTSTVQRVIEFSVSDGDGGGVSNKVTKTVNVSA